MKVTKSLPLFIITTLFLSACSTGSAETAQPQSQAENTKAQTQAETTQAQTQAETKHELKDKTESMSESIESELDNLELASATNSVEDLANYLKENNMIHGEAADVPAEALGAISGAKYDTVAIYEYDKESDSYKGLIDNGYVVFQGLGTKIEPSAVNDRFMLLCDQDENRDEIIKVFMEYK